jgi:hypothetical protein
MTRHLLLSSIVATALVVGAVRVLPMRNFGAPNGHKRQSNPPFSLPPAEGLSIPIYDDKGEQSSLLKVGKCQLRQRRIGLLGMVPVTMVEMSNVEVDVESPSAGSAAERDETKDEMPNVVNSFREIPRFLRWNDVQGFEIQGIKVTVHDSAGAASTIQAAKLSPLPKQQLFLSGGVVLTVDARRTQLATDQVVWWPRLGVYAVKGPYSLTQEGRLLNGRRELFAMNLEPITNAQEIAEYEHRATLTGSLSDNK